MQENFLTLLESDAALIPLLNPDGSTERANVAWIQRPDANGYPALTLTTISEIDDLNQEKPTNLTATRVQLDFWGSDSQAHGGGYAQTRLAFRAVKNKFQPINGVYPRFTEGNTLFKQVVYEGSRDMPSQDLDGGKRVFHLESDFIVWHRQIS